MMKKIGIILIALAMIIPACTPVEAIPMATSVTIIPTDTPIPPTEPAIPATLTNTPQPTHTPTITPTLEPDYTSCNERELLAEVDANFAANTRWESVQGALDEYAQIKRAGTSFDSKSGLYNSTVLFVGMEEVSISHFTGGANDFAICGYFVEPGFPDSRVPVLLGTSISGEFKQLVDLS